MKIVGPGSTISLLCTAVLVVGGFAPVAEAEVYIYRGPDGERMISDRPPSSQAPGYELLTQRDTLENAGNILAGRRVDTGNVADYRHYIIGAAEKYDVDPDLIEAVIQVESGFDSEAVSKKGATGLMQLMYPTAQKYKVYDRFNPRENIYAGVKHLAELMEKFDRELPLVIAAYNAGAGAVERYRGIPPFPETQDYVKKVLAYRAHLKRLYAVN